MRKRLLLYLEGLMSKKKKRGKRGQKKAKKTHKKDLLVDTKSAWQYSSCKHPASVKIGEHDVILRGYRDRDEYDDSADIRKLDIFIGLDSSWDYVVVKAGKYKNPWLQSLHDIWIGDEDKFDNLFVFHV